jgi:hypothetical protein
MKNVPKACMLAVGLMWFAACSDSTGTDSDTVATSGGDTAPVDTSAGESTTPTEPVPPAIDDVTDVVHAPASGDFVGALEDVSGLTCDQEGEGWRVTGIATNPTETPVDYRIYVSLLNTESATRALVETELLAVGPLADAMFDELIAMPDTDLRCVLRVERRAPGT